MMPLEHDDRTQTWRDLLAEIGRGDGLVVVLTGAGISAESGIPTFRGPEGYWTVGSKVYMPEEMATRATFERIPEELWRWYLYRLGVCWKAEPNPAHLALVRLETALQDRFILITQNVDGLHLRAGNSPARTFQIHGNINLVRCSAGCDPATRPVPDEIRQRWPAPPADRRGDDLAESPSLTDADRRLLTCPNCGNWLRPHVLWFDEYYDEQNYCFERSLAAADRAALLLVVGTSGATNLPNQVAERAYRNGAAIGLVDPNASPFSRLAERRGRRGHWERGPAGRGLPPIVDVLVDHSRGRPAS
jgi:NAD-dependent deacetylase